MYELQIVDAAGLARAYAAAEYGVTVDGPPFELHVGAPAPGFESAWPVSRYAFVTAWNPASSPQPGPANEAADARLRERLDRLGVDRMPAWAQAPDGRWREPGWLVADLPPAELDMLAREFGQAGTLCWSRGEPVRLRMLIAPPPGAAGLPCVDWVE
jgi:hypothetical protein